MWLVQLIEFFIIKFQFILNGHLWLSDAALSSTEVKSDKMLFGFVANGVEGSNPV